MRSLSLLPSDGRHFIQFSSSSCETNFFLFEISSLSLLSVEHELRCVSDSGATWCRNPGETPGEAEGETPGEAEGDTENGVGRGLLLIAEVAVVCCA